MSRKKEFGDFQTPESLAKKVVPLVNELFGQPDVVIEPTAGLGNFLKASSDFWGESLEYEGYEINQSYVELARANLSDNGIQFFQTDFFSTDWNRVLSRRQEDRVLVIGNPPWVTNSDLGFLGSRNLPEKSNDRGLNGIDAKTGKSNFDIAESMLIQLVESIPHGGAVAMLCKTMTARKVLHHLWNSCEDLTNSSLFLIDAKSEFDVAVDACLFFVEKGGTTKPMATVYPYLAVDSPVSTFGSMGGRLVSDIKGYRRSEHLEAKRDSNFIWRSGVKHDASKVMEFTRKENSLVNGFDEFVDIEDEYLFPLLKSSDLGNGRTEARKSVLVTQKHPGEDTSAIGQTAPKTWDYLMQHAEVLDHRRSSIYQKRARFSIFGVGPYSFHPWKIAISGLYKVLSFVVVPPCHKKPTMVDDTCYFLPCHTRQEAELIKDLLTSELANDFFHSRIFLDSKRPITIDVLRRLSLFEIAQELGRLDDLNECVRQHSRRSGQQIQMSLFS